MLTLKERPFMKKYLPVKALVAIITIGIVEICAMGYGMNGVSLAASIAAIAGLGGFAIGQAVTKKAIVPPPE